MRSTPGGAGSFGTAPIVCANVTLMDPILTDTGIGLKDRVNIFPIKDEN